jgi:predicted deacylase
MAAALRVVGRLDRRELRGSILAYPVASPRAFALRSDAADADADERAARLRAGADAVVALRSGGRHDQLAPSAAGPAELTAATGLPFVVPGDGGLVLRAGGGQFEEGPVRALAAGVRGVLRHLGMLPGGPAATRQRRVGRLLDHPSPATGWWTAAVHVGEEVDEGSLLGRVRDRRGTVLADVRSPADGVVLALPASPAVEGGARLLTLGVALSG